MLQDILYAGRVLIKKPVFTAAVALSLSLGIGANTAIFTLMDAVLWRMLPVKDPESLVVVGWQRDSNIGFGFTYQQYRLMREENPAIEIAGYSAAPLNATIDGSLEPTLHGQLVTGNYFSLLGVAPVIGRAIGAEDDRAPNSHPVAMLSYGYWQRRFARDPSVVGRTIRFSSMPFTIIGVTPASFSGVEIGIPVDVFLPIMMQPVVMSTYENLLDRPIISRPWVQTVARLKPGAGRVEAEGVIAARLKVESNPKMGPASELKFVLKTVTESSELQRQFSRPLYILMSMVGVVLIIACANTANLLLARAASRRPEFAMRLALGAGRLRLLRQLLVESIALATLGGIFGALLAFWATRFLVVYMSSGRTPIQLDLSPNLRILAFTAAISVFTGIVFGLAPALRATKIDLTPALKNLSGTARSRMRADKMLAIVQMALSLMLLVGAGLFVRTMQSLNGDDTGVPRDSVIIVRVEPRGSDQRNIPGTTARLDQIYRGLLDRIRRMPGIRSASLAQAIPSGGANSGGAAVKLPSSEIVRVPMLMVYPDYFATVGIPLLSGRDFNNADLSEHAQTVCIVNEAFARAVFPGENPIGKPCIVTRRPQVRDLDQPRYITPPEPYQIIGIAKDSRYTNPRGDPQPVVYTTFLQTGTGRGQMVLHARVAGHASDMIPQVRQEILSLDPTLPQLDVHTLEQEIHAALVQQRLIAMLSSFFGALALVLACVGLYGLLAFAVVQRFREMGVRMALGASRGQVIRLVMREALLLVGIGIVLGIPASVAVARLVSSGISGLLYGLQPTDPLTIAQASLVLIVVAGIAAYLPARRASRADLLTSLRAE